MRSTTRRTIGTVAAVLAAIAFAGGRAQAQMQDPDAERARQLVIRIRSSMKEIDTLLLSGAQPAKVEKELAANVKRIDDLLKETESKSQAVMKNIEELIQLAKSQQSQDSSSSGDGKPPPKGSQSDPNQMPQRQRSQEQELQKQQQPQGAKPDEQKKDEPEPKGGEPKSGRPKPEDSAEQRPATRPPPLGPTGDFERKDLSGRWGMLPPKEAEELQRRNADDFPQRYRRWMELYFQRVNQLPSRGH
jgi:hypothetical protein